MIDSSPTKRRLQLRQHAQTDVEPLYQLSVIRMNGTFLELIDKCYAWKGVLVTITAPIAVALLGVFAYFLFNLYAGPWNDRRHRRRCGLPRRLWRYSRR